MEQMVMALLREVGNIHRYLGHVTHHQEHHRHCLLELQPFVPVALPIPPALADPPWAPGLAPPPNLGL